jgi:hypothetical protein
MYELVDNITKPLQLGEKYLVPCIVSNKTNEFGDEITHINPVINLPHSDKENGQNETHYHLDYRFIKYERNLSNLESDFPKPINSHSTHRFGSHIRPELDASSELLYIVLPVVNVFKGTTPVVFINKSKLKPKCFLSGKCPHKGYNLSQVPIIDGVITCPLHGLKINKKNGKILNK